MQLISQVRSRLDPKHYRHPDLSMLMFYDGGLLNQREMTDRGHCYWHKYTHTHIEKHRNANVAEFIFCGA